MQTGLSGVVNLICGSFTPMQGVPACANRSVGKTAIHYRPIYKVFAKWAMMGRPVAGFCGGVGHLAAAQQPRPQYPPWRRDQHRPKRGNGIGYSGYKHQKGEKIITIIDNNGAV